MMVVVRDSMALLPTNKNDIFGVLGTISYFTIPRNTVMPKWDLIIHHSNSGHC